jgi:hypothetical protein
VHATRNNPQARENATLNPVLITMRPSLPVSMVINIPVVIVY